MFNSFMKQAHAGIWLHVQIKKPKSCFQSTLVLCNCMYHFQPYFLSYNMVGPYIQNSGVTRYMVVALNMLLCSTANKITLGSSQ